MSSPIVVVSTAVNCPEAARRCCLSVVREGARHLFRAADMATYKAVREIVDEVVWSDPDVGGAVGQIANLIGMIKDLAPNTIVIHLDGDDELTRGAVRRVEQEYEEHDCWLTYGSFRRSDGVRDRAWHMPFGTRYSAPEAEATQGRTAHLKDAARFRRGAWRASHLRTFRAGLFQLIPEAHYTNPITTQPFTHCVDRALMLPMIEMAGERYSVISDVLCIYNCDHDRSMTAAEREVEARDREAIHSMRGLAPLRFRPW